MSGWPVKSYLVSESMPPNRQAIVRATCPNLAAGYGRETLCYAGRVGVIQLTEEQVAQSESLGVEVFSAVSAGTVRAT